MLVHKRIKFLAIILLLSDICFAQETSTKTWGFTLAPGLSKSYSTAAIGYPDPPFYVDLKVTEPLLFSWRAEIYKQKITEKKLAKSWAAGYSLYNYIVKFDYDHSASIANNVSDRYDQQFLYLKYSLGKAFDFRRIRFIPYGGLSFNYLIRAKWTYESIYRVTEFNQLNSYDRWNIGWEIGIGTQIFVNDKFDLTFRPSYNQLVKTYDRDYRRLYSFNFGIGLQFKK